jgi:hypothetical protein
MLEVEVVFLEVVEVAVVVGVEEVVPVAKTHAFPEQVYPAPERDEQY